MNLRTNYKYIPIFTKIAKCIMHIEKLQNRLSAPCSSYNLSKQGNRAGQLHEFSNTNLHFKITHLQLQITLLHCKSIEITQLQLLCVCNSITVYMNESLIVHVRLPKCCGYMRYLTSLKR